MSQLLEKIRDFYRERGQERFEWGHALDEDYSRVKVVSGISPEFLPYLPNAGKRDGCKHMIHNHPTGSAELSVGDFGWAVQSGAETITALDKAGNYCTATLLDRDVVWANIPIAEQRLHLEAVMGASSKEAHHNVWQSLMQATGCISLEYGCVSD